MASERGLNAAQQMGLSGSSPAIQAIQSGTAGIVANDRQKYLDDLMNKYMTGIGIGKDIYGTGANTAGKQSENDMNMGTNSAETQFNKTNAPGGLFQGLLGLGGGILGTALGGPLGGVLGTGLANKLGWSTTGGK
jgi:hypothetical protein